MLKYICLIAAIFSVPGEPWLCDIAHAGKVYPIGEDPWFYTFKDLAALFRLIGAYGFFQFAKWDKRGKVLTSIFVGYASTDVFEKWVLNDRSRFTIYDLLGMFAVAAMVYYEHVIHDYLMRNWELYSKIVTKINGTKVTCKK
jgi:hypothetical protein